MCSYPSPGADDLLPYIIYTVLLLSPKHMHSNLRLALVCGLNVCGGVESVGLGVLEEFGGCG